MPTNGYPPALPAARRSWRALVVALVLVADAGRSVAASETSEPRFERVLSTGAFLTGAALQDRDGFLWFGSQGSGLFRYDGAKLVTYEAGRDSISDDNVLALHEDHEGVLWIATARGVSTYDKRTATFRTYLHDPTDATSIASNTFNIGNQSILEDRAGQVWIGTRAGLDRFARETGAFVHYRSVPDDPRTLLDPSVFALLEDRDGRLWVGSTGGLSCLDAERRSFTRYRHDPADPTSLAEGTVMSLAEDASGALWIGLDRGLDRFDRATGRFAHYTKAGGSLPNDLVHTLHVTASGRLWVGHNFTGGGLTFFDPTSGTSRRYGPESRIGERPSSDSIAGILTDRAGITWFVHLNGAVDTWDPSVHAVTVYPHVPDDPTTISDTMVNTSYVDRAGVVWFATPNGLNRLDRATGRFTRYPHAPDDPAAIPSGFVCGPLEDSEGNFWVLSDRHLSRFARDAGVVVAAYDTFRSPISVIEDRRDSRYLWLCSWGEGLARFDRRTETFAYFRHDPKDADSLSNDLLVTIYQAPDGLLWVPTMGGGLDVFDPATGKVVRRFRHDPDDPASIGSDTLTHVFVDSRGRMWVGGYGGGLARFDPATGGFVRHSRETGFPTNTVTNILEDNAGQLWLGTKAGFVRFDPETGASRVYTIDDGLAGNQFQEAALAKSPDGTLWVATITGACSFRPDDLVDSRYVPPVVLTSLEQGGAPMKLAMAPEKVRSLELDWRQNFFEFELAALSYSRSQKNRFRYKLEGFDRDWFDSGTHRFGRYANIPDGTFTLRVIGSNSDGLWNEEGVSVRVTVTPPFWRTAWFRLLAGALVLAGGALFARGRAVRARRAREALERDVAERTRSEAILRESEGRFRALVTNVPGAFYRAGFDGHRRMRFLSPGFEALAGQPPGELLGPTPRPFEDLVHPDDRDTVGSALARAVHERSAFAVEYRLCRSDGGERWLHDRGQGEFGREGELVSLDGVMFDITERRNLETQLLQAHKLESIGRLAGGVAHDLNSLLTVVVGNAELAAMELPESSPVLSDLEQIREAGERAGRLTSQLLVFARRSVVRPRLTDLNDLVLGLDKMLRRLVGAHIELVTIPGDALWAVEADPAQLEQVVLNLALNARDAMPDGGRLAIRTANVDHEASEAPPELPAGDFVLVEVADSGHGMTDEVRQHIFEPFFTTKGIGQGTGLGLASCYGIVQQAHGHIAVETSPGRGSTFRVFLPRAPGAVAEREQLVPGAQAQGGSETILLVEDEGLVRDYATRALEQCGYHVLPATDGEHALRLFETHAARIELVLTDVVMPRMGGKELVQTLHSRGCRAAILYMSGYDESSAATGGVLAAGVEWLPKPFAARELARRVRAVLDRREAEGGP